MRKKTLQIFLVVAIGMILISLTFAQTLSFSGREGGIDLNLVKTFGLGLMAIAGALISMVMCVTLIPQEIERRTIYTILSKPVKRYEFIVGKFLGACLTLGANIGLMGLIFIIAVFFKARGAEVTVASVASQASHGAIQHVQAFDINMVWGVVMIFLQFLVLSSVVLFFSVFLTPTVNFFMGTGVYLMGVMASLIETFSKSENAGIVLRTVYKIIHVVVPNFDRFNLTNPLLHPETADIKVVSLIPGVTIYALLYVVIMMTLTVVLFERKEV